MFEFINDGDERGQVGIGTLIVFIAMVLVAAIAAGVLINTAGFLQSKSQATGEEASSQVSNRISVVSAYGNVNRSGSQNVVEFVNLTVRQAAGAGNINLSKSTIQWIGPDDATTLIYAPKTNGETGEYTLNESRFGTEQIKADGDRSRVLVDSSDRLEIVIWAGNTSGGFTNGLPAGSEVQLTITTQFGSKTSYWVNIPESLESKTAIRL
ncbi:flagellin [Halobacterium salinarum]|uniref:archaellin/type IV pilin N-terminal domain-containing protein n=1 Tax=Halobacterium salinarum TaxID=2242 RepID=UPI002552819D|nr:archaellin/type IV pilin N-terminal domain-containing protein [Halobacterium salinarum]MDL0124557.1 flagellin [Halobacterium salinarum]MDL0140123.1 flagellin [Halobacterium salinarum]